MLGVFGLSIRTQERDLDDEFSRFGRVEKVTIVYDQRVRSFFVSAPSLVNLSQQSDRSRGFGFIRMATVEDATRCIQELNGVVRAHITHLSSISHFCRRTSTVAAFVWTTPLQTAHITPPRASTWGTVVLSVTPTVVVIPATPTGTPIETAAMIVAATVIVNTAGNVILATKTGTPTGVTLVMVAVTGATVAVPLLLVVADVADTLQSTGVAEATRVAHREGVAQGQPGITMLQPLQHPRQAVLRTRRGGEELIPRHRYRRSRTWS